MPLTCAVCERTINPGDKVQFFGIDPEDRIVLEDPSRMQFVYHATCRLDHLRSQ